MNKEKVVGVITIISAIVTLVSELFYFILPFILSHSFQLTSGKSGSIGIIGGADGPTAIYVANKSSVYIFIAIFALLSITGVLYLFHIKKVVK
mgnify:CR=1 FL=1